MKCPNCNGVPYDEVWTCEVCNGKGIVEPLTEQEYLQTCTTGQLAEWIFNLLLICSRCGDESQSDKEKIKKCPFGKIGCAKKDWVEWLKQPHRGEP